MEIAELKAFIVVTDTGSFSAAAHTIHLTQPAVSKRIAQLEKRLDSGEIREVILATGATVEGEATARYIAEIARERGALVSRIAQGVPLGGELEYIDSGTLAHALSGRGEYR